MRLREWRERNRMSLGDVARRVGVSNATAVRRWEVGGRVPRPHQMAAIYVLTAGAVTPNSFYDLPALPAGEEAAA